MAKVKTVSKKISKSKLKMIQFIFGVILIIILGTIITLKVAKNTEQQLRSELLFNAKIIVAAINPEKIKSLSGTINDNDSANYKEVREQALLIGQNLSENIRWVYSMRVQDDRVVFLYDSTPIRDFGHTEPGDAYIDAPIEIFQASSQGISILSQPYDDVWGDWISVFAPIKDFRTGEIVGVLGVDASYSVFLSKIYRSMIFPASIFFLIFIIYCIIYFYIFRRNQLIRVINEQKVKNEAMLLSIGEGVVICDQEAKIIFANQAAEKMLQFTAQNIIGKCFYDAWPVVDEKGEVLPKKKRYFYKAYQTKKLVVSRGDNNFYYVRADGTKFPIFCTVAPVFVDNFFVGVIAVFRDISHEHEIDRMKTEFVSLVSHQLRSPLTAIKYSAELLADQVGDKADKNTMEYIGAISQYTSNMVALINSLLNISRIESGRLAINPEPTDLEKLTQSVIKEVGGGSKVKNQTLTVEAIKNLPKINIDVKLIYEVIKNILTNAIKYTPKKGKINISILVDANNVILQVSDNGYGIPKKEQDKIFQKFHRASNVANNIEGSGLGLYLVKIIIKVSGGKIWFESKEGKGTTFWLSLPLSGSPAKAGEVSLG